MLYFIKEKNPGGRYPIAYTPNGGKILPQRSFTGSNSRIPARFLTRDITKLLDEKNEESQQVEQLLKKYSNT